jgi:fructoselysine and glucoselysine-specific PTS system IIA component
MEQNITRKFLIATHGQFASGVKSSLDIIIGQTENLFLIEAYVKENKGIESEMEAILNNIGERDELIIFTDLLGGSITNQVLRSTQGRNVHVVSGFNLALLIEVLMADAGIPAAEVIESAIANAKEQMAYVNKLMTSHTDDQAYEN